MNQRPLQELRLRDFRCFREQQTARLAPLTLLVGENSTGKTSFLAAIRAMLDVGNYYKDPDFRASPYDLGSFPEIAHRRLSNGGHGGSQSFTLGFRSAGVRVESVEMDATFTLGDGAAPTLSAVVWGTDEIWVREVRGKVGFHSDLGCASGAWRLSSPARQPNRNIKQIGLPRLVDVDVDIDRVDRPLPLEEGTRDVPTQGERKKLTDLYLESFEFFSEAFPGAPIRSNPKRTYDPVRLADDPDGSSIPSLLAHIHSREPERWSLLKDKVSDFGRMSGLFDEIAVHQLGHAFEPFQLEVVHCGNTPNAPKSNVIDVGYGVSQVLPLLVALLDPLRYPLFLLQQPEIHLHPRAQAALGSLFCASASAGDQLIVETHSEYIIDRVRMDIRDRKTELRPDEVSVLFFERTDLGVHVHSLRFDEQGNLVDAPDGYGRFFMDETRRSIGL